MYDPAPRPPARILFEVESDRGDDTTPSTGEKQAVTALVGPTDISELTPELAARRSAATSYGDLAAIIRLQSIEIERLALENDRLTEKFDDIDQRHDAERDLRQKMEQQVLRLNARSVTPAPAPVIDVEVMRRAAREGMSAEIKPVLMSILDLLETSLPRNTVAPPVAPPKTLAETLAEKLAETPPETSPVPPSPARHDAPVAENLLRLPDILTRPLEELTTPAIKPEPQPFRSIEQRPAVAPHSMPDRRPAPPRAALPGMFAWTSLFS